MAKISDGTFRDWHDTETIDATEYKREREILKVAVNDNDTRLDAMEEYTASIGLGNVQMQKITDDTGGVNLTTKSTTDNILQIILEAGKGFHTFYAVGGSNGLPHTNLSIRGIAHFTSNTIGWVYATDYKNNVFTNYYDSGSWSGWKDTFGWTEQTYATALNGMTMNGFYYVQPGIANAPTTTAAGNLMVMCTDWQKNIIMQVFVDLTGNMYTRAKSGGSWSAWKKSSYDGAEQTSLWSDLGKYMIGSQTVTPTKKLSQCRNGWILCWCDYNQGTGENYVDIAYSYIPRGTAFKSGHQHLFTVPNFLSATTSQMIVKKLMVYDDKLVGHDDNAKDATNTKDVVLIEVLEW